MRITRSWIHSPRGPADKTVTLEHLPQQWRQAWTVEGVRASACRHVTRRDRITFWNTAKHGNSDSLFLWFLQGTKMNLKKTFSRVVLRRHVSSIPLAPQARRFASCGWWFCFGGSNICRCSSPAVLIVWSYPASFPSKTQAYSGTAENKKKNQKSRHRWTHISFKAPTMENGETTINSWSPWRVWSKVTLRRWHAWFFQPAQAIWELAPNASLRRKTKKVR